jgi:Subtilase family
MGVQRGTMSGTSHPRRAVLAATLALATAATTIATPSEPATAASACGPLGTLKTYSLNDRCNYGLLDIDWLTDSVLVTALGQAGLLATLTPCADQGLSSVPILAVPDELLVTASSPERLQSAVSEVRLRLVWSVTGVSPLNPFAAILHLRRGTLGEAFLRQIVPTLQGRGFSTDLNYLEPALPNYVFRPAGNPATAPNPGSGQRGQGRVLVVDSPAGDTAAAAVTTTGPIVDYDVDGNGFVDEDHGHGVFVASLIERLAPKAEVVLAGVNGGHLSASDRWSPMVFSDADVIAALGDAFGISATGVEQPFDVVNLSLGGSGCNGVGSRLALGRFLRDLADLSAQTTGVRPVYVAAAGNDGGDVKHFPAAWRHEPTIQLTALLVDLLSPLGAGAEIRGIQAALEEGMIAVGSRTGGVRDSFSNCGSWVNAVAAGKGTVSRYPSPSGWASWSGTSFATARVSAAIAGGQGITDVVVGDAVGTC